MNVAHCPCQQDRNHPSSDEGLKILDENIMFLFCGPGLEPTRTFGVTFVILVVKWSEAALFGCHEIHASFPWAPTTTLVCELCSGSLQATPKLQIVELLKVLLNVLLLRKSVL